MCRTLTLSTEPLPKTANEDKDSALHTGQFSASVSQSHMQTVASPGKRACCFPPGWETASHSRPQPSSEAWRSKACETGTSKCVRARMCACVSIFVSVHVSVCICVCTYDVSVHTHRHRTRAIHAHWYMDNPFWKLVQHHFNISYGIWCSAIG